MLKTDVLQPENSLMTLLMPVRRARPPYNNKDYAA